MRQLPSVLICRFLYFILIFTIRSDPFRSKMTLCFKIMFELLCLDDNPFFNGRWGPIDDPFNKHLI